MDANEVVKFLTDRGADDSTLDELVHDVCSELGSAINNGGFAKQVEFLLQYAFADADELRDHIADWV